MLGDLDVPRDVLVGRVERHDQDFLAHVAEEVARVVVGLARHHEGLQLVVAAEPVARLDVVAQEAAGEAALEPAGAGRRPEQGGERGHHLHELRVVPALALVVEEGHVGHEVARALAAELVVEAGRDLVVVAVAADDVAHLVDRVVAVVGRRRVGVLGHLGADRPLRVLGQVVHRDVVEHGVIARAHAREDLALDRRRRAAEDGGGRRAAGDALEGSRGRLGRVLGGLLGALAAALGALEVVLRLLEPAAGVGLGGLRAVHRLGGGVEIGGRAGVRHAG